ncbi:hypothetical protein AGABI1DRAFT_108577 [Agaricus bisporus var. burnettii JB137-S8]|uniref:Uncharacterized protein n=1 Tax=Agaricus bisporus var. burnettii (strain JB137-S8 / ATCC MYA-4627 / FGSC 10392) TaxID=597362 RepID=K5WN21_AGABU|nr:uncharacterized protein AGABI1DRAFT_108577 [Agaricus bisporus var. burnettii JB137-S8]EKM76716.1 hypothetical protein AGABI1DRAFT_108577 [Agaricus bisporus var. burnettii JB137-S8]
MIHVVTHLTVAKAATIINAAITFVQVTLPASLVLLVIHFMSRTNQAVAWSSIGQILHSSIWPTLLRSDSTSRKSTGFAVPIISILITVGTVLVAIAGIILPLGLHDGPLLIDHPQIVTASYLPDKSPLALATTPNRYKYQYGRPCGPAEILLCPDLTAESKNTTYVAPTVLIFNSTPHGPFTSQYRRFYNQMFSNESLSGSPGLFGTIRSFLQQDSIFAVEGLIVDMTIDHPGIGFWNTTVPEAAHGGTWSQDVLWLEPLTECIPTNLTVLYELTDSGPDAVHETYNLTDHGGFYNLTPDYPPLSRDGQHINLSQHAYKGAALSNFIAMLYLNTSRESSFEGKNYTIVDDLTSGSTLSGVTIGRITPLPLSYLNGTMESDSMTSTACQGFGQSDVANKSNVHVSCGAFLGPPLRTDGGDLKDYSEGSKWKQDIHVCASTTRASIQTITFSSNNLSNLQSLRLSRKPAGQTVLWGIEKGNLNISSVDLVWGRIDDRYENDSSIWAVRSEGLYLPAGRSAFGVTTLPSGSAHAAHETAWKKVYETVFSGDDYLVDYRGTFDYAMRRKYQAIVEQNPVNGYANIRNIVWTDMMLNSVVGTATNATAFFSANKPSIEYRMPFAIPGFILLAIWLPSFLLAIVLIGMGALRPDHMRDVLNHTSIGRAVVGASALRDENSPNQPESFMPVDPSGDKTHDGKDISVCNSDVTPVTLFLNRGSTNETAPLELTTDH